MKIALVLTGCLGFAAVLAMAWATILSTVPLWAIVPLGVLIVVMAVRDP